MPTAAVLYRPRPPPANVAPHKHASKPNLSESASEGPDFPALPASTHLDAHAPPGRHIGHHVAEAHRLAVTLGLLNDLPALGPIGLAAPAHPKTHAHVGQVPLG